MSLRNSAITFVLIVTAALAVWIGEASWRMRQWFALQSQQLATIKEMEEFVPAGWSSDAWRNALVTLYNVWGNVTYHPSYSQLTIAQMRDMQSRLGEIRARTTPENAIESVDKIFELLTQRCSNKSEFITGFREEFRSFDKQVSSK